MKASRIALITALIAGVMLAYSPALHAQDAKERKGGRTREGRPGRGAAGRQEYFNKLAEDLNFTAEQKTKVQEVFKNRGEKGRAIRQDSNLSDEQKREKSKALMEETNKKMKEILNAEQYEKWEKKRAEGRRGGIGGQKRGARKGADKN